MNLLRSLPGVVLLLLVLSFGACSDGPSSPSTGELRVDVSGLPAGTSAAVTVTGPGGFSRTLSASETLSGLASGDYTVSAAAVSAGGTSFGPLSPSQSVQVQGGGTATARVEYASLNSALLVTVRGVPAGASPSVTVTGPGGFSQTFTGSRTLTGLTPGTYTVFGAGVAAGDSTYQARPLSQEAVVTGGAPASVELAYSGVAPRAFNLRISAMYLVQATQNREGTVPMVATRDGILRVFAVGDPATNTATPMVRVRVYEGEQLRQTYDIPAGSPSVGTAVNQASLNSSWNVKIPGALIRPGLRIVAEVDPGNGVVESNESDNTFPASGTPQPVEVLDMPTFRLRLVPIHQSPNGLTGRVSAENRDQFMSLARKIHPIPGYDADVRATYTTNSTFDPQGNAWQVVVAELDAVRVAEGSGRYYYGVVRTPYNGGGVVGIARDIGSRTAIGWDLFPYAPETLAHEIGHNWGRFHAPCGSAGGVDPNWPRSYTLGQIGVFGLDVETGELKPPGSFTDIMGYCDASWWISDYTFTGVMNYRLRNDAPAGDAAQPSLLVWGRVVDGEPVMEPAFQVNTVPELPTAPGPYRVEGLDAQGGVLFSLSFAAGRIPDMAGDNRSFAFAVPLSASRAAQLATVRLVANGKQVQLRSGAAGAGAGRGPIQPFPAVTVRRERGDEVSLRWDGSEHPAVMVRDARTGQVLSLARGGEVSLVSAASELELIASDGVRSVARRVRVQER